MPPSVCKLQRGVKTSRAVGTYHWTDETIRSRKGVRDINGFHRVQ